MRESMLEEALLSVLNLIAHVGSCECCWTRPDCEDRLRLVYVAQRRTGKVVPAHSFFSYSMTIDGASFDKKLQIATQNYRNKVREQ